LESATWIVAIWTANSIRSRWVRTESMAALERDALIPILLDDVTLPVAFRTTQVVDLRQWRPDDARSKSSWAIFVGHRNRSRLPQRLSGIRDPDGRESWRRHWHW
ncbi:MAG: TIR domain-containing protein, partial [Anaerolineae bacterium]|nr:TIR domain-containing protein [Anaerolineae bacterium]